MKNVEFINNTIESLQALEEIKIANEAKGKDTSKINFIIKSVRYHFAKVYDSTIFYNFYPFCTGYTSDPNDIFTHDDSYVCREDNIAIEKDNNLYRVLKIKNPEAYQLGTLITESHDDFPFHTFPESYVGYRYPEIAMVKYIAKKNPEWLEEECQDCGMYRSF